MRNPKLFVAIAALLIGQSVLPGLAADEKSPDAKPLAEWEAKLTERSAAGKEYAQRFHGKTAEELAAMASSGSTQLALLAKWESLGCRNDAVAPPEPSRFLGYLEGKTGLTPPLLWQYKVTSVAHKSADFLEKEQALQTRMLVAGLLRRERDRRPVFVWPGRKESGVGVTVDYNVEVRRDEDWLVFSQARRSTRIPHQALPIQPFVAENCSVLLSDDYSALAVHNGRGGGSSKLLCYDARTSKQLWETQTWGSVHPEIGFGIWLHHVELVRAGDTLGVFGCGTCGHYLEAFDLRTGKNLFRVSADLWDDREVFGEPSDN